jgi:glycosyltransferase involved in cell wall biosynthesis
MSSPRSLDRFLAAYVDGSYFRALVNGPQPHALRQPPAVLYHATLNRIDPISTIVTPIFNGAPLVAGCIRSVAAAASLPFDLILVDDGSDDATAERAIEVLRTAPPRLAARATVIRNPTPTFETSCDNMGFWLAETELVIEVQSDIEIREPGFDARMRRALAMSPQPAAVSGRCGHSFFALRARLVRAIAGGGRDCVGLCGKLIDTPEAVEPLRGRVYRCQTVPRGPWAVCKRDLEQIGYLDERFFFLGNDDHDYHRRLFDATGRRPVYLPMSIYSPLSRGASRRRRSGINREVFALLEREKRGSPAFRRFVAGQWRPTPPEPLAFPA